MRRSKRAAGKRAGPSVTHSQRSRAARSESPEAARMVPRQGRSDRLRQKGGAAAVAELPFARERGQDGGGAEPQRQRAKLGEGKEEERPPAPRGGIGHGLLGQRVSARFETGVVGALGVVEVFVVEVGTAKRG